MELPLALLAVDARERRDRALTMLDAVGIGHLRDQYPRDLSGGELQRIAIARALIHRPRLVLADEPTGNLDPRTAVTVLNLLRERIAEGGGAGILITHSQAVAESADRVYVLDGRSLVQVAALKHAATSATLACFRLGLAQLRMQPLRTAVTVVTLAFGIALFSAVQLVNAVALNEFSQATRRLAGEADLIVKGPPGGFDEQLYADLAVNDAVRVASPSLELDVTLAGTRGNLAVRGLDTFRASALQPALIGHLAGDLLGLFGANSIHISEDAARALGVKRGDTFGIVVGDSARELTVRGILPAESYPGAGRHHGHRLRAVVAGNARQDQPHRPAAESGRRCGCLSHVPGAHPAGGSSRKLPCNRGAATRLHVAGLSRQPEHARTGLAAHRRPAAARHADLFRAASSHLACAAPCTGGDAQRHQEVTAGGRTAAGCACLGARHRNGIWIAWTVTGTAPVLQWVALAGFFLLGTGVAGIGAWLPAREAADRAPARGLKSGDAELAFASLRPSSLGLGLLALAAALSLPPPIGGIPLFGYAAIASLLTGGLLLVPASTRGVLALMPTDGQPPLSIGLAQVRGSVAQLQVSLAPVIVSFSLMVAMSIMVFSFRQSFVHWLQQSLPADIQLRIPPGSDTRVINAGDQAELARHGRHREDRTAAQRAAAALP